MFNVQCSSIAKFFNPILIEKLKGEDLSISVDLNAPDAKQRIADKCMKLLLTSFMNALPEEVGKFIEHEHYQDYTLILNNDLIPMMRHHAINPPLFELSASKVAHYLFPNNFAEYKFIIRPNMDKHDTIYAGYFPSVGEDPTCNDEHLEGVENVYATAFFLGLEIRSHQCVKSGQISYLFIDDFSHSFHKIDAEQRTLIEEYRDHKISPSEEGTLFPTSFLNEKCGEWINRPCDIDRLKSAYERITSIAPGDIKIIIDTAISVFQSIECQDDQDDSCKSDDHYHYMHYKANILGSNYDSILLFNNQEL